jgi:hypothetical protein
MEKSNDFMLTTVDNPFNPFNEFESWFKTDLILGWKTCQLLANEANTSEIASDSVNEIEILEAMKRIVSEYPLIYQIISNTGEIVEDPIKILREGT